MTPSLHSDGTEHWSFYFNVDTGHMSSLAELVIISNTLALKIIVNVVSMPTLSILSWHCQHGLYAQHFSIWSPTARLIPDDK